MKQIIIFLAIACALLSSLPAFGRDFSYTYAGQTLTYTVINETEKTCKTKDGSYSAPGNKVSGDLTIPSKALDVNNEYTVVSIGDYAFSDWNGLTSVIIPGSVSSIGDYAFNQCNGLTSVTIPASVTSIGRGAFQCCIGLTSLEIPESVTKIGVSTFRYCSGLTSVTIPESVTSIGDYAFESCSGLTSLEIPESVISIGDYAFSGCSGLTSVTIPKTFTSISWGAFKYCSGLTSLEIPESVTSIGNQAFSGCNGLTSVTIPESVTTIGGSAFSYCRGLTSVTIPASVTEIGNDAFTYCTELKSVLIKGERVIDPETDYIINSCIFYVPASVIEEYRAKFPRKTFEIDEEEEVATLLSFSFDDANLTATVIPGTEPYSGDIVIPSTVKHSGSRYSVTSIGEKAFYECSSLTSVTIPESVTSIGDYAFCDCSGLTSVTIPSSVISIGDYAFAACRGLTSVTIPSSVTSIGEGAFWACSGLTSVTIPASVTSIGEIAFNDCTRLEEFIIDDANPAYASYDGILFNKDLTQIICYRRTKRGEYSIPESVTSIGRRAFYLCDDLTSVTIPESVTTIGSEAFFCSGLKSVTIPESVTSIGDRAFQFCSSLTSVIIPSSVISIGDYAFSYCSELKSIQIKGERVIDPGMSDISSRCTFYVPMSVIKEYRARFPEKTFKIDDEDAEPANFRFEGEDLVMGLNDAVTLSLSLVKANLINGFQLDLSLPVGLSIAQNSRGRLNVAFGEGTALNSHALAAQKVAGDNRYRIVAYSTLTEAFASGDGLLRIPLESDYTFAGGEILIDRIELTFTADFTEKPDDVSIPVEMLLYGDANDNGRVAIDDAVTQIHHIMENNPQPFHFKKADVNRDGSVTVTDVIKTISLVLGAPVAPAAKSVAANSAPLAESAPMSLSEVNFVDGKAVMTISLGDVDDITALQGDLILPEGVTVNGITLANAQEDRDHRVDYLEHNPSTVRFAVYSLTLDTLEPNAPLLDVEMSCTNAFPGGRIALNGIMLTDAQAKAHEYEEIATIVPNPTITSALETIIGTTEPVNVYNLQGIKVKRNATRSDLDALAPGIYIISGAKVLIR